VVSKKVHKSAVKRNKIRRRLYETLRRGPEIRQNVDLIFTVYTESVLEMSAPELSQQVDRLLHQAKVV
jgi:ribonuclease P protein component